MSDMETGMKAFKRDVLKSVKLSESDFRFEPEVTIKLAKKKYKFFNPIHITADLMKKEKNYLKGCFKATYSIFKHGLFS